MKLFCGFMSRNHQLFVPVTGLLLRLSLNGFGGDCKFFSSPCVTVLEAVSVPTLHHKVPFPEAKG